jgi:hypothetical protein
VTDRHAIRAVLALQAADLIDPEHFIHVAMAKQ